MAGNGGRWSRRPKERLPWLGLTLVIGGTFLAIGLLLQLAFR
jgi:hypothetical protein